MNLRPKKREATWHELFHKKFVAVYIALALVLLINQIVFNYLLVGREQASAAVYFGNNTVGTDAYPEELKLVEKLHIGMGETNLGGALIDNINGYAYFGTATTPAQIVKIKLSTLTKEGAIILGEGDYGIRAGVIDEANGFAYFGTYSYPAQILKLDLSTFTIVDSFILGVDEGNLSSGVIDLTNHYAYFSSANGFPAKIVKIDISPTNFSKVATVTLDAGETGADTCAIDEGDELMYCNVGINPSKIVKIDIDPNNFSRVGALTIGVVGGLQKMVIDKDNNFGYVANGQATPLIYKINLGTFSVDSSIFSIDAGTMSKWGHIIDETNGYAYFAKNLNPVKVYKVDINPANTFQIVANLNFNAGEITSLAAVMDDDGNAYFTLAGNKVVKVDLDTFTEVDQCITRPQLTGMQVSILDEANGYAYIGTSTSPAQIVKVNLSTGSREDLLTLNAGENNIRSAVIDTTNGYAYFGTYTSPGMIVKVNINPASFARVGAIILNAGENNLTSSAFDPVNGYAYFGTYTSPGIVVKVDVNDPTFARVGAITLNAGENNLASSAFDPANGYAYFGTYTSPGIVVKVDVNDPTFARVGAITLNAGENSLTSSVIDPANGFVYFGTYTTPAGKIVKIDLSTFSEAASITLETSEVNLTSATIDLTNGYAYFGTDWIPGRVISVDLATFTRDKSLILASASDSTNLNTAFFDTTSEFIYFVSKAAGGVVAKIADNFFVHSGYINVFKATLGEPSDVDYFYFYSHEAAGNLRLALYDSSLYRIWQSNVISNTIADDWLRVAISNGSPTELLNLAAGDYWLGFQTDTATNVASFIPGASNEGFYLPSGFGIFPAEIVGESYTSEAWSIYGAAFIAPASRGGYEQVPAAPVNLRCQALNSNTILWTFEDTAIDEKGFRLYGPDGPIWESGPDIVTDLSYIDETGLKPDTLYEGRYVVAYSGAGESLPSNTASCTTRSSEGVLPFSFNVGDLVKRSNLTTVYLIDEDYKRHPFPNEGTYFSWFVDFSPIKTISETDLAAIPIGSNVTVRPGSYLMKIDSVNKVYAVEPGGIIRWIETEETAAKLFGDQWGTRVIDISPVFFTDYQEGISISSFVHPAGSLISYLGGTNIYYIDNGQKREVSADIFSQSNYQVKFVVIGLDPALSYADGETMIPQTMIGYLQ